MIKSFNVSCTFSEYKSCKRYLQNVFWCCIPGNKQREVYLFLIDQYLTKDYELKKLVASDKGFYLPKKSHNVIPFFCSPSESKRYNEREKRILNRHTGISTQRQRFLLLMTCLKDYSKMHK